MKLILSIVLICFLLGYTQASCVGENQISVTD